MLKGESKYRSGHLSPSLGFKTATNTFLIKTDALKSMNEESGQILPEVGTANSKDSANKPEAALQGLKLPISYKGIKNGKDIVRSSVGTTHRDN